MLDINFSESQLEAINVQKGATLVLAGPGSGKTAVLTTRVANLVHTYEIDPAKILVITFTRAAAEEMKTRFMALEKGRKTLVTFGTFHAIFFNILKAAYGYNSSQIIKPDVKYNYMRQLLGKLGITSEAEDENDFIDNILGEISSVKNNGTMLHNYYSKAVGANEFRRIYEAYEKMLRSNHLIDFDDMLLMTYKLLNEREDHLNFWQNKYKYILIDEAQDMNRLQYEIIKLISAPEGNIFMVGDDDQSIYAFRGALPGLLRRFVDEFKDTRILELKENYRCDEAITTYSDKLIKNNSDRFSKNTIAIHKGHGAVTIDEYEDVLQENDEIIKRIQDYLKAGINHNNIAILFRTNRQSSLLMEMLGRRGIPYESREKIPIIYDHWICKDLLAYLRLGYGGREREDIIKIMNKPLRYLSRDMLISRTVDFEEWKDHYFNQNWMAERISTLEEDLKIIGRLSPFAAINYIRKGIGYEEYIRQYVREKNLDMEETLGILEQITMSSREYKTYDDFYNHIISFKDEMNSKKNSDDYDIEAIQIMTLHSAKGLEFDVVFMPQMNENLLPYKKALLPQEIEEERRLCYVGMTRAKMYLHMSSDKKIFQKESNRSIFIDEIKA